MEPIDPKDYKDAFVREYNGFPLALLPVLPSAGEIVFVEDAPYRVTKNDDGEIRMCDVHEGFNGALSFAMRESCTGDGLYLYRADSSSERDGYQLRLVDASYPTGHREWIVEHFQRIDRDAS